MPCLFLWKNIHNIKHLDKNLVAQMHCFSWRGYILDCITHPWKTRLCLSWKHTCNRGLPLLAKLFCILFSHVLLNLGNLFFSDTSCWAYHIYNYRSPNLTQGEKKNTSPFPGGRESSLFNPTGSFSFMVISIKWYFFNPSKVLGFKAWGWWPIFISTKRNYDKETTMKPLNLLHVWVVETWVEVFMADFTPFPHVYWCKCDFRSSSIQANASKTVL